MTTGEKIRGLGLAQTVAWTQLAEAMRNDGMSVGDKCPPHIAEFIREVAMSSLVRPADGAHCATCSCTPGMTKAIRFDASPSAQEGVIREHLISLGWTPPGALASDTGERGVGGDALVKQALSDVNDAANKARHNGDYSLANALVQARITLYRAALRAQPAGGGCELKLRRLLAVRVAGAMLYTDDGELSDGAEHPAIDFLRHSPEEIESLLRRRAELKAAIATLAPPESGGQGLKFSDATIDKLQEVMAAHGFAVPVRVISDAFRTASHCAAPAQPDGVSK